jgi:LuxR family maltose regulon positive regulatory protein
MIRKDQHGLFGATEMWVWRRRNKITGGADQQPAPMPGVPLDVKTHVPEPRTELISRARLVTALSGAHGARLVLLSAPAGFGKSTLIAEWRAAAAGIRPFAWVSLDVDDNDPVSLWTAIVTALDDATSGLDGDHLTGPLRTEAPDVEGLLLPRLLNALAALQEPVVLVLDDYHVLQEPACHRQIESFLDRLPPSVQLVLATRADPLLPLARYRATGDIVELRMSELAFTGEEAALLVRRVAGIRLRDYDLGDLIEKAEGWPAAIYLAALSLRESGDPETFIRDFAGTNRLIFDYLSQEVLRPQPFEVRRFLRRTAILDRFTAPLCDAVANTSNALDLLAYMEQANLFLTPLDDNRQWYRYHHLFMEALRGELVRTELDLVPELHRRASTWLAAHDLIGEAIAHALAGADLDHAVLLFARHWIDYVNIGRVATVRGWMESIGEPRIGTEPVTAICAAWVMALFGHRRAMRHWLAVAESLPHDGPLPDGSPSVAFAAALQRAIFGFDGVPEMLSAAETAVALGPEPMSRWYALARTALGYSRYLTGDLEGAIPPLDEAAESDGVMPTVRILALSILSLAMGELGHTAQAAQLARVAHDLVQPSGLSESATVTLAATALGAVLAREGEYDQARQVLQYSLTIRRRTLGLTPWPTLNSLIALARTTLDAGDLPAARALLDEAHDLVATEPDSGAHLRSVLADIEGRLAAAPRSGVPRNGASQRGGAVTESLTEREVHVLRLLRGDLSLREIGRELYVSANTVKTHTRSIYRKLGVSSREEAIERARELGLL